MADRIQLRRDVEADWTSNDPTLSDGEPGWVSDTDELVVGDGSTAFSSLTRFITSSTFDVQTDSDGTNAVLSETANTTYLTLNFSDPGQAVSVMAVGTAVTVQTSGTGQSTGLTVNIDGNRPAEESVVEHDTTGTQVSQSMTHGRTWTPSGAFTVTLELWDATSDSQTVVSHVSSTVTAIMVPG